MVKGFLVNEAVKGESLVYKHVNLKHAMFKFYALTEGCHPRSMPSCLTATTFFFPHKRNYYEHTITKNQGFIPPTLNSPAILKGMSWVKCLTPC